MGRVKVDSHLYVTSESRQRHLTNRNIMIQYILNTHIHTTPVRVVAVKYEYAYFKYVCNVCKVFCPETGPSLDMHYQCSIYLNYYTKERSEVVCQVLTKHIHTPNSSQTVSHKWD